MTGRQKGPIASFFGSRSGIAFIVFLIAAGYFLWTEHRAHVIGALPLVLFLAVCIGMHFFMHGGHGSHTHDDNQD